MEPGEPTKTLIAEERHSAALLVSTFLRGKFLRLKSRLSRRELNNDAKCFDASGETSRYELS